MRDTRLILSPELQHMVRIGEHPDHKAVRERTDARIEDLKKSHRLYEDRTPPKPPSH
jgi:hypothetical protein